ncbi:MAG: hypothetical protein AAF808_00445 [Cyanobacteria bacterium P01_D01_bin.2]
MDLVLVYRIKVFCPPEYAKSIIDSVLKITHLTYGNYDCVAWTSAKGIEQFRPLPGSQPTEGSINEIINDNSVKVEFSIPRDKNTLKQVIEDGIFPVHPWEEPVVLVCEEWEVRGKVK